tara:strand:- start:755 stop:1207 length:453 start_codon:yes stop_codon:yes gene_type:complete
MPIVGFNFDKFHVERKKPLEPPIKVDSGIKILDVKKEDLELSDGKKQSVLRFDYDFTVTYAPNQAEILINGHLILFEPKEKLESILGEWKKTQKFDVEITQMVMNNILLRCNIKALLLGQEVGLPPHIRLPVVQPSQKPDASKKAEEYIG